MRSKSSRRWLDEHHKDPYVEKARQQGYRARASFKLLEIHERHQLIKPGMRVLDLGAAPGSWSQVAAKLVGAHGQVIASDILDMEPINKVQVIKGDFTTEECLQRINIALNHQPVDLVISDMAPNMSGMMDIDQPRAMYLAELALDLAVNILKPKGAFVTKIFQGEGVDEYIKLVRQYFTSVANRKPSASRPRSREIYLVARQFRG